MSLKSKLESSGVSTERLDSLVYDAACRLASRANNEGLSAQIELLEGAGFSESEIAEELGIEWEE